MRFYMYINLKLQLLLDFINIYVLYIKYIKKNAR